MVKAFKFLSDLNLFF